MNLYHFCIFILSYIMYYVLMSFPSLLFVYEIFFIRSVPIPIFQVYLIELGELMLLRHLTLDFYLMLRYNTSCDKDNFSIATLINLTELIVK